MFTYSIPKGKILATSTVTYERIVDEILPQKSETRCTWLNVGGNIINFLGVISAPTADITTAKLIFNNVLSTKNAELMCTNIANLYLNNPMDRYEYMKPPLEIIRD